MVAKNKRNDNIDAENKKRQESDIYLESYINEIYYI